MDFGYFGFRKSLNWKLYTRFMRPQDTFCFTGKTVDLGIFTGSPLKGSEVWCSPRPKFKGKIRIDPANSLEDTRRKSRSLRPLGLDLAWRTLLVERDIQFRGKLVRVEGAAGKIPLADSNGRHFPAALVYLQDECFRVGLLIDIHFREVDAAFLEEPLGAAAVHAPSGAINRYFVHTHLDDTAS